MPDHVAVYKDEAGDWRWVRIAGNGERLSGSTEGYENRSHATEQAYQLNPDVDDVRVEDQGVG